MMKSICQALILSAVYAIEAETAIEAEAPNTGTSNGSTKATYGMNIAKSIPSPKYDAIVFPTDLSTGGGSEVVTISSTVAKLIDSVKNKKWEDWNGLTFQYSTKEKIGENAYFVETVKNSTPTAKKLTFTWSSDYKHIYPATSSFVLAPGKTMTNVAQYKRADMWFSWSNVYRLSKTDA